MRLRTRGLLVGGVDQALYVARPELEAALLDPLLSAGNVLLVGPAGSGKTTSLRKLEDDLERRAQRSCFVNGVRAETAEDLIRQVVEVLDPNTPNWPADIDLPLTRAIRRLAQTPPAAILIDGPIEPAVGRELFGRYRDELWSLEHRWAVTTTPRAASQLRLPPADAFWDRTIALPPFRPSEVNELLQKGLDNEELASIEFHGWPRPDPAWPRSLVRVVREQFEGTTLRAPDEVEALRRREAGLDPLHRDVLAALEALRRPAAAGDPDLLSDLGYSRAYVARALSALEELGLVVHSFESTEGKNGRPKKLYEPALRAL